MTQLPDIFPGWADPHVDLKFEKTCECGTERVTIGVMEGCEGWTRRIELSPQLCHVCCSLVRTKEVKRFSSFRKSRKFIEKSKARLVMEMLGRMSSLLWKGAA